MTQKEGNESRKEEEEKEEGPRGVSAIEILTKVRPRMPTVEGQGASGPARRA